VAIDVPSFYGGNKNDLTDQLGKSMTTTFIAFFAHTARSALENIICDLSSYVGLTPTYQI
jgi:hypothetical protein